MLNYSKVLRDDIMKKMYSAVAKESIINIKGGEELNMVWRHPLGDYTFEIERQDNSLWWDPNIAHYMITCTIRNNVGAVICQPRFTEVDCVRILDCLNSFNWDEIREQELHVALSSHINPLGVSYYSFIINRDTSIECPFTSEAYDFVNNAPRDMILVLCNYDQHQGRMQKLLQMRLSRQELDDFIFAVLFSAIIDIELPEGHETELENFVTDRIAKRYNWIKENGGNKE